MPIVNINLKSGRSLDKKRMLVEEVTKAICKSLDVSPNKVHIILSEMAPENYSLSGVLTIDQQDNNKS